MTRLMFLCALLALAPFCGSATAADAPDLTGTWTEVETSGVIQGTLNHNEPTEVPVFHDVPAWTMTIIEQSGRSFTGTRGTAVRTETLLGTLSYDGHSLYIVDDDSYVFGTLMDDGRIEICTLHINDGARVSRCSLYEKQ